MATYRLNDDDIRNFARCAICAVMAEADCRGGADANTVCAMCGLPMVDWPPERAALDSVRARRTKAVMQSTACRFDGLISSAALCGRRAVLAHSAGRLAAARRTLERFSTLARTVSFDDIPIARRLVMCGEPKLATLRGRRPTSLLLGSALGCRFGCEGEVTEIGRLMRSAFRPKDQ